MRLDLPPAELTVGYEGLALVYLFGREVSERDGPAVADYELDLLPAAWTCGVMSPPCGQAGHAELVAALEPPEVLLGHCQANGALGQAGLRFLDLLHPARHSWVDDVLSPLGSRVSLRPVPELRRALLGVFGVPPALTSLCLA